MTSALGRRTTATLQRAFVFAETQHQRRRLLCAAIGASAACIGPGASVQAQAAACGSQCAPQTDCPSTIVVPFPPGGSVDTVARPVAAAMGGDRGSPVIVENKAGAAGTFAAAHVANQASGRMLLFASTTVLIATTIPSKLPLHLAKDLLPVAMMCSQPLVLLASLKSNLSTFARWRDAVRQRQGMKHGSIGAGSLSHFAAEALLLSSGGTSAHVAYRGAASALYDLLAGEFDFGFFDPAAAVTEVRRDRVYALAVTGDRRCVLLPSVPTVGDVHGMPLDLVNWMGLFISIQARDGCAAAWVDSAFRALRDPRVQETLEQIGAVRDYLVGDAFSARMAADQARLRTIAQAAGIALD
jgi:tripartite-type tricarboxylate transporter receptor subunit TctC